MRQRVAFLLGALLLVAVSSRAQIRPSNLPAEPFRIEPRRIAPAPFFRERVVAGASSEQFLVTWADWRSSSTRPRVWATRLDRDGTIRDRIGFPITAAADTYLRIYSVASDGRDFLVAFGRCQKFGCTENATLFLASVTAEGSVTREVNAGVAVKEARVAWIGDSYSVVYRDHAERSTSRRIGYLLADRRGDLIATPREMLWSPSGLTDMEIAVNERSARLHVIWTDFGDGAVHTAAFPFATLRAGTSVAPPVMKRDQAGPIQYVAAAATNGETTLVLSFNGGAPIAGFTSRVVDGDGITIRLTSIPDASNAGGVPTLIWRGTHYDLITIGVTTAGKMVRRLRLDANGVPLDDAPQLMVPAHADWSAAACKEGLLIAGVDQANYSNPTVVANVFGNDGAVASGPNFGGMPLSLSLPYQQDATGVWLGDHYLVAWTEVSNSFRGIAARFDARGNVLDPEGIDLGYRMPPPYSSRPNIATDGRTAIVAGRSERGIRVWFFSAERQVSWQEIEAEVGADAFVHWNGSQYLIAWFGKGELKAIRLHRDGSRIDAAPFAISKTSQYGYLIAIGWIGRNYVAVWHDGSFCLFPSCPISFSLMTTSFGSDLLPIGAHLKLDDYGVTTPVIGEGRAGLLVVWPHREYLPDASLLASRITPEDIAVDYHNPLVVSKGDVKAVGSVHGTEDGWMVMKGRYTWSIRQDGAVSSRVDAFPFLPENSSTTIVLGGPAPLLLYQRPPQGLEATAPVEARYIFNQQRRRAASR